MATAGTSPLDAWSLSHFVAGVGLSGLRLSSAALVMVCWELVESVLRKNGDGGGVFEYESRANVVADVAVGLAGWLLGRAAWSGRLRV